jgi:hypothetical protein
MREQVRYEEAINSSDCKYPWATERRGGVIEEKLKSVHLPFFECFFTTRNSHFHFYKALISTQKH